MWLRGYSLEQNGCFGCVLCILCQGFILTICNYFTFICTYLVVWKKPRCSCASSLFVVPERQSSLRSQTSPPQTKLGESWHRKALMPWRMTYEEFASGTPRRTSMAKPFLIGRPAHHEKNQRLNLADAKSNKAETSDCKFAILGDQPTTKRSKDKFVHR